MLEKLRRIIGTSPGAAASAPPASLEEELARAADRFEQWARRRTGNGAAALPLLIGRALDERKASQDDGGLSEAVASDAAAALGEHWRAAFGGRWAEDPLHGIVLAGSGGLPAARLIPLSAVLRRWERGDTYCLEKLTKSLEDRLAAEAALPPWPGGRMEELRARLAGLEGDEAAAAALSLAGEFRAHWRERPGGELPLSLVGVRALDGFLRTHYISCFLGPADLARAGFFLGEVGRGLFEGRWDFRGLPSLESAPLRYPELDYFPIGRIFKMMTGQPAGEPLDEYLRLIPSARAELRGRQE